MLEDTLIAAARLGDDDAFTELYEQHVGYVRSVARSILHSHDLEDLCQDVFLLAFSRLHAFEGGSSFRTWLTRIAINQCLIALRKSRQPSNGACNLVSIEEAMATDAVLDRCVFATEDAELRGVPLRLDLDRLLARLPKLQRRLLEMAYIEGIPDVEIAETLGMSLGAVRTRLYRAKIRMRAMFDGKGRDILP